MRRPARRPRLIGGIRNRFVSGLRRLPLSIGFANRRLDRRLHQRPLLGAEQGAKAEHAVVLEERPHPTPAHLLVSVPGGVEIEHAAAGAADPRQLRPRRGGRHVEPDILILGGGHQAELAHAVEGQLPGRKGGTDARQRPQRLTNAEQLITAVRREPRVDGQPVGEGANTLATPPATPPLELMELGSKSGKLRPRGVHMRSQLAQASLDISRASDPRTTVTAPVCGRPNRCCHKGFIIPNMRSLWQGLATANPRAPKRLLMWDRVMLLARPVHSRTQA